MAGLDGSIGLSGLLAAQRGMDVVGHNIANASTPGYTRQSVELTSALPLDHSTGGQLGTGVRVSMVRQVADLFLDGRVRVADATNGYDTALSQRLGEVEAIVGDTSDSGLSGLMSAFFSAADALGVTPDDPSTRVTFLSSVERLAEGFRSTGSFLEASRVGITREVEGMLEEVNQLAQQVAELNLAILNVEGSGQQANDLRDQRGVAARRLSRLVGAEATQQSDGGLKLTIGGRILVTGTRARPLEAKRDADGNSQVFFEGVATPLSLDSGEVGGLLAAQRQTGRMFAQVDQLAQSVIQEANRVHATGVPGSGSYTSLTSTLNAQDVNLSGSPGDDPINGAGLGSFAGPTTIAVSVTDPAGVVSTTPIALDPNVDSLDDFASALSAIPGLSASVTSGGQLTINAAAGFSFDFADRAGGDNDPGGVLAQLGVAPLIAGRGALDMALADGVTPQRLAAGLGPGASDGRNALRFSGIGRGSLSALDGEDPQGFLAVIVSEAGHEAKVASDRSVASERVLDALETHREGVSGVSMEEEVANMIRFQRGFEAASRYLSVLNGLSDELMRMLG